MGRKQSRMHLLLSELCAHKSSALMQQAKRLTVSKVKSKRFAMVAKYYQVVQAQAGSLELEYLHIHKRPTFMQRTRDTQYAGRRGIFGTDAYHAMIRSNERYMSESSIPGKQGGEPGSERTESRGKGQHLREIVVINGTEIKAPGLDVCNCT